MTEKTRPPFPRKIRKVKPPSGYPPEEGRYLRGNDFSPVVVVAILNTFDYKIPRVLEEIVRASVESGAALAGLLQTENIGIEKVVTNVVANPNIRYLVLCGPESKGHLSGQTLKALVEEGVDDDKFIVGSEAATPYLFNIPMESIARFRDQIDLIDLLNETDVATVVEAVRACYQERPTKFRDYEVYDIGAYPEPPICQKITQRLTEQYLQTDWLRFLPGIGRPPYADDSG